MSAALFRLKKKHPFSERKHRWSVRCSSEKRIFVEKPFWKGQTKVVESRRQFWPLDDGSWDKKISTKRRGAREQKDRVWVRTKWLSLVMEIQTRKSARKKWMVVEVGELRPGVGEGDRHLLKCLSENHDRVFAFKFGSFCLSDFCHLLLEDLSIQGSEWQKLTLCF